MTKDSRKKDFAWHIKTNSDGTTPTADAQLAVLMDIRDELKAIRQRLGEGNINLDATFDVVKRMDRRLLASGMRVRKRVR